jgi:hypothetical protein
MEVYTLIKEEIESDPRGKLCDGKRLMDKNTKQVLNEF